MQVSNSIFSDPSMRSGLEKYYENKKSELIETLKERDSEGTQEISFVNEDGETLTAKPLLTAETAEKSLVSFDKWLELQQQIGDFYEDSIEPAKKHLDMLKANNPDSSSNVRATFSSDGTLYAYINADGSLVTSNGADDLQDIAQKANDMGLTGQKRIDYLTKEVKIALSQEYYNLDIKAYDEATSPTNREFAKAWYKNYNIDANYQSALAEAQAHFDSVSDVYRNWQSNMSEINNFLLSFQEVAEVSA